MALALTIGAVTLIVVLGVVGALRGVARGLLTIACTLLGAVLIDLWVNTWQGWLVERLRPESPGTSAWLVATGAFLAVALLIGYGSGAFIPTPKLVEGASKPKQHPLTRPISALLGALNAAVIVGYLLRYGYDLLGETARATIDATLVLRLLHAWLPWFVLTVLCAIGGLTLARSAVRAGRYMLGRQAVTRTAPATIAAPQATAAKAPASAAVAAQPNTSVAGASSQGERLTAVNNKIGQALDNKK